MPKGKAKKTMLREKMRARCQKGHDKQGRGTFSRLPKDIPAEFEVYQTSRGIEVYFSTLPLFNI